MRKYTKYLYKIQISMLLFAFLSIKIEKYKQRECEKNAELYQATKRHRSREILKMSASVIQLKRERHDLRVSIYSTRLYPLLGST